MRTALVVSVFLLMCACVHVHAHSKLVNPLGWNPNPSTAQPCGGGTKTDAARATWRVGTTATITWEIVANDGSGPVTALVDTAGGSFTDPNAGTISTLFSNLPSSGVGVKTLQFTVPSLTCTGTGGLCTVRVYSSSSWTACSTVKICNNDCPTNTTIVYKPVTAQGLTFCKDYNGRVLLLPEDTTPVQEDSNTRVEYTANVNNTNVFANGRTSKDCQSDYFTLVCGLNLPLNPGSNGKVEGGPCRANCQKTLKECAVTTVHQDLYDCDALPLCDGESSATILSVYTSSLVIMMTLLMFIM